MSRLEIYHSDISHITFIVKIFLNNRIIKYIHLACFFVHFVPSVIIIPANPKDPRIREAFMMWNKAGGKVLQGLVKRREAEANLYLTTD